MLRLLKRLLLLIGLAVVLFYGSHAYAAWRVRSALLDAGMSSRVATCMTKRMVKRLTLVQLMKLQALEGDKPTIGAWIRAVRKVGDSEVILVTTSSAALCKLGIAR